MASQTAVEDAAETRLLREAALAKRASFQESVSTIVRMLMARRGVKQTELAKQIGYTQPAVSDKLSHRRKWNLDDLWVLADHFEVDVSLFFEDPEELLRSRWFAGHPGFAELSGIGARALAS